MTLLLLSVILVLFLAFANGANDNFKGVATLYGSGTTTYRRALIWSTVATALGSLTALYLSAGLVAAFSGKGLVPDSVLALKSFSLAVVGAAALTVTLATRFGFPVSTTHALMGALVGAGYMAAPGQTNYDKLLGSFVTPLLVSPLLTLVLSALAYLAFRPTRWGKALDRLHFLSAGAVCFARALNDTPKIAAILLTGNALSPTLGISGVALAMVVGGLVGSRRIAETMAHGVTQLNPGQGFSANLVTSLVVIFASKSGLPVSTTHVACGSLFGIATVTRQAKTGTIVNILTAWVTTLPIAAVIAAGLFALFR